MAADDITSVWHQRVKISVGADGAASDGIPVSNGLDTTAAGVLAVGVVGQFDDTATGAVTENQFAPVRISTRRALLVEGVASGTVVPVSDGGGNLSVDWAGTVPPIGAGTEAAALRVTLATDSTGLVSVDDNAGSLTVDNAGTFATQVDGAALTSLQKIDNIAHSGADVALVEHVPISGQLDDAATTAVTENQIAPVRISTRRALLVEGVASGTDINVAVNAAIPAGTNNIGDIDVLSIAAGDNNIGNVDIVSSALPSGASTAANQSTIITNTGNAATSLAILDDWDNAASDGASVSGDVAHDTADAGEPVKVGFKAIAHGANPTAVTADDRTNWYANRHGVPWVIGGHPNVVTATYLTTGAQTDDNVLAAIAAGNKYVITRVTIALAVATTVAVGVRLGFGASVVPALPASAADAVAGILVYHPGMNPGSGIQMGDGSGILGIGGDGEELRITCDAPTSGTLVISVSYYQIES